ncbi:MAG: GntR family transcriptional regulator [Clostridia bacterium]|nr:GntR family transcriptional regulator [Clostridia bacterium]
MFFEAGDKQSLTSKVYDHIRNGILDGSYKDGDYLVETRLAEKLQVSRTPIREALKQLELEGLVLSMPNRGVVVQAISENDIDDIYIIRQMLEGLAAYWAAQRRTQEQLDALAEKVDLMDFYTGRGGAAQLSRLDNEFHELIYRACASRMLSHILASLHQNTRRARTSSLTIPSRPNDSLKEHRAVFAAIEAGDPEAAKDAMEKHVKNAHSATM